MKKQEIETLKSFCDDTVTEVFIETPEGWRCPNKNCPTPFFHKHSNFSCLTPKNN